MPTQKPTQSLINIDDIRNGIVYMQDGGVRKILIVNGVNFDLKSEQEQNLILGGFQRVLNSLDFSVQFFIHSRKVNIKSYLKQIKNRGEEEENELLKTQIEEYIEFVKSLVAENPIVTKSFFVIIPYSSSGSVSEGANNLMDKFKGLVGKGQTNKEKEAKEQESFEQKIKQLNFRVDEVVSGLRQVGLRTEELGDDELMELLYNLYNPQLIEKTAKDISKQPQKSKTGQQPTTNNGEQSL